MAYYLPEPPPNPNRKIEEPKSKEKKCRQPIDSTPFIFVGILLVIIILCIKYKII